MRVKRYKHCRTDYLKSILDDPYTRGVNGFDYEYVREELQEILWKRKSKELEKEMLKREQEQEYYENEVIFVLQDESIIPWLEENFRKLSES